MSLPPAAGPRVVLFRHAPVERDSRAKKWAMTLARIGYEVVVVSAEPPDVEPHESAIGPVRVVHVPVRPVHLQANNERLTANRLRRFPVLGDVSAAGYYAGLSSRSRALNQARRELETLRGRSGAPTPAARGKRLARLGLKGAEVVRKDARLRLEQARGQVQRTLDAKVEQAWTSWDERRATTALFATVRRDLPEVLDLDAALREVLVRLEPDVLHAHHPFVLGTAVSVREELARAGRAVALVYDARENFAGIPPLEQGHPRRHSVLVDQERRHIGQVDAVSTVSEPIADALARHHRLTTRPLVVLNTPPATDLAGGDTVRDVVGLPADEPLLVYSGTINRARGLEVLVDSLVHLPGVHLVVVSVPHPHPSVPRLRVRAARLGVAERIHVVPPVGQDRLIRYLSGADVAVHPMPGGSANHDQALPNKLFEYLHAGLPIVVSDARLMADLVTRHGVGQVFTSGDERSLADAVRAALDDGTRSAARIRELAARYSWQAQEDAIRDHYARVSGWTGRAPSGPFPAMDPA